jgi:hypothetical protein
MEMNATGEWALASGAWAADGETTGLTMLRTALGYAVSPHLTTKDISSLIRTNRLTADPALHFPPEFAYCPSSGARLELAPGMPQRDVWIPPFGAPPATDSPNSAVIGLQQSGMALRFPAGRRYDAQADADVTMIMPPAGDYEFFSARFGTSDAALVALDPLKGTLFAWLPESGRWAEMESGGPLLLEESKVESAAWRAELVAAFNSRMYVSTQRGLACVTPDVPSLNYKTEYFGGGAALAAPVWFDGKVWAPVQAAAGNIEVVSLDERDSPSAVSLDRGVVLGAVSAPVSSGRMAIWACEKGQLRLHKQADGKITASFTQWPEGVVPQFQFGCAFHARDGALWQLCFDHGKDSYLYFKLGSQQTERVDALAPRFCSGTVNYRFAAKLSTPPWDEPELGDDGASNEVVMPLIESSSCGTVIGVKFNTTAGLADVLRSGERMRAQLVMDDGTSEMCFHTIAVSEPWRLRLFFYKGTLWAYHPMLNRIVGWMLQT